MTDSPTFVVVLLHEDRGRDRALQLPPPGSGTPPVRVRVATTFAGAAAWDVYELVDGGEWPEQAVYHHVAIEPSLAAHLS
ncbi:hypothetical protein ACF1AJ_11280 [Leifsonia sp. NPDC014704]|uniref:hypothetical protein n=1 Tax=Leifsonia sp. NPDC014704 TaxID=3364123 RepID=UPI0036F46B45